jgi:hypothetical protein
MKINCTELNQVGSVLTEAIKEYEQMAIGLASRQIMDNDQGQDSVDSQTKLWNCLSKISLSASECRAQLVIIYHLVNETRKDQ